jgi:uncharacterized protein YkwD
MGSRGIVAAMLALAAVVLASPAAAAETHVAATARAELERALIERINAVRRMQDREPLDIDPRLGHAARAYAERMAGEEFFDHVSPDGSRLRDRVRAAGYDFRITAENLAAGRGVADLVVSDWMQSPGHRESLLRDDVVHLGVGYAYDDAAPDTIRLRHYWVMLVGAELQRPAYAVLEPRGAPRSRPASTDATARPLPPISDPPASEPVVSPASAVTADGAERRNWLRLEPVPEERSYYEGE